MATSESSRNVMKSTYTSLSGEKTFELPISSSISKEPTTAEKTAYLSELRSNTKKLQENINAFLTQKMQEDKIKVGQVAGDGKDASGKTRDEAEEENYGEEKVEDED